MAALGLTDPTPNRRQYPHGTLGAYATAKCRCEGCRQWAADYGRDRSDSAPSGNDHDQTVHACEAVESRMTRVAERVSKLI